ncbi:queuine tRNA-ribosyltransferase [Hydrogenobaculum sp. Y04AAS1]|uniref:tRNA guanosine(34) transglycosylase Tgt n=1 Tax=Hydrogenobaculum sp. (strain Y04AAS1) TaxID=380749 RepID=UPI00015BD160|nr:queuine tRNA-ribosyltransferase [Hydrogenobaculum sp. Y04AAS1]HCT67150.1 tRNA guanosine(34) transglycosylase Tgt [Hydrogenobaculum sp.]
MFKIEKTNGLARAGILSTLHGDILTPVFMPVGTKGTVKAMTHRLLEELGTQIILGNTYHLYLRPGPELIEKFGGLHKFINWNKPILTDSGGFQVFSLSKKNSSNVKITDDGVYFKDHLQGDKHLFSPEKVIEIQEIFGSDIMMPIDECISLPASYEYTKEALYRTIRWLERSKKAKKRKDQMLFGIVQGGEYKDLRKLSARLTVEFDMDGYSIGGLSVGESKDIMYSMTYYVVEELPFDKPHYLMGVGKPEDILEAISLGIDMFDCVIPTRNARTGLLYTSKGELVLRHERYKEDPRPVDEECECYTCKNFSRAYLRHLFMMEEISSYILNTIHNLHFFLNLTKKAREAIIQGRFLDFKSQMLEKFNMKNHSINLN